MSNFMYLRSLNLGQVGIERLPHYIGKLKHLRALYLNGNRNIKKLPSSLCRLQNLQTLRLSGCSNLEKLPRKTRLDSLRYLYIDGCDSLAYMPRGLGQLTCLRTLNEFIVGKRGKGVEPGSSYLKEKLNLKSLKSIWDRVDDASNKKYEMKHLKLSWSNDEDEEGEEEDDDASNEKSELVFERLQPHPNLEMLVVYGHSGLKVLENVSEIEMQKELSSSKSTKFFPSLKKLQLLACPNFKGWWRGDVDEGSNAQLPCFPCLSDLTIYWCPHLTSMPLYPSVRELNLEKTSWKQLQETVKLKMTTSEEPSSSSCSSLFPPSSKSTEMLLEDMEDLDYLPEEFLQNLTSLRFLYIISCTNLTSMPKGMRCLTSLQQLQIEDCPELWERCQRDIGVTGHILLTLERLGLMDV
ncbi:putative disease resistance protein RGA1 [Durio zibethinus]|uniref:Disease resistance protein RGA1 n=1 Tax=Durio zibethinus TaxID=66656 RepID=A0A6P5X373_DURZI|nr:putative disease resistance protein RGA1 [Durio zibethinus]